MKTSYLFTFVFCLFFSYEGYSQVIGAPDPCTDGTEDSCKCGTAPILCTINDLDGYDYEMDTYLHPADGPDPMCPPPDGNNTTSHNPTWFGFLAWCSDLTIDIEYTNCISNPNSCTSFGIQAAVYEDCSLDPDSAVACATDVDGCVNNDVRTIELTGMEIGDTYYLLVDGCCGSACDILITVVDDCGIPDIEPWDQEIQGPDTLCFPANDITYSVVDHPGAVSYAWFLDGVQIDKDIDLLSVDVDFPAPGEYEICVDVDNKPCILIGDAPDELCKTVLVIDGTADAGDITAVTSPSCPDTEITFSVANYTGDGDGSVDFDQWLFLTDDTGEIVYVVEADAGAYTSSVCGTFTVYSYNFYNGAADPYVVPAVGDNVDDFSGDCLPCYCDLESLDIVWEDTEMPVFTAPPADITVDCYDEVATIPDLDYTDNCAPDGTVVGTDMGSSDACTGGSYTRTWTATDACDNETTYTQTITVDPAPQPVFINVPDDENLSCADLADGEVSLDYTNSSVGACLLEGSVVGVGDVVPDICGGDVTYTWSTLNACGNVVDTVQLVTIDPPLDVEFLNVPDDVTITCAQLPFTPVDLMYTNLDIGGCLIEGTEDTPEIDGTLDVCADVITITWEVTDFCGRVFDTVQLVTLEDTDPPTFDAPPADMTFDCYPDVPAAEDIAWSDNCDGNGTVAVMTEVDNANQCDGGTITRTWEYTDDCDLTVTHTQTLTINPPAAVDWTSTLPTDIDVECGEALPSLDPLDYSNGTGDGCDDSGMIPGVESGVHLLCGDEIIRTWDYTPTCGDPITHTQTITLIDVTPPELQNEPADETYDCYIDVPDIEDLTWTDNCDGTGTVSGLEAGTIDDCNGGTITRTWTYTDECGTNTDTHVQTITVTAVPAIVWTSTLPADMTIECIDDPLPMAVNLDYSNAPISDSCLDEGSEAPVDAGAFVSCGDQITRTWTATAVCGEVITHVQTFTFDDTEAPEFTDPQADMTFDCYIDVPDMEDLDWTDNCEGPGAVPGMETGMIDDCDGGTIMRTWTYTDLCDNTVTHTQTITVTAVPEIVWTSTLPADMTIECIDDALPIPENLDYSNAPISDSCLDEGSEAPVDAGAFVSCGDQITRTWTATAVCGEVITHVQTFTFDDTEAPEFTTPPADITLDCYLDVTLMEDLDWTDNCEGPGTTVGIETGTIDDCLGGTIMRTWEQMDLCDNTASHTQTITVLPIPDIAWISSLPIDVTIECITDALPAPVDLEYSNSAANGCLETDFVSPVDDGMFVNCNDEITRTWEVIPICGPTLTHVQTFTFQDTEAPEFTTLPDDLTLDCYLDVVAMEDLAWTDNCEGPGTTVGIETGTIDDCVGGTIMRMWEQMDLCDNTASHTQTITVLPIPDIAWITALPADVTVQCSEALPALIDLMYDNSPTGLNCEESGTVQPVEMGEHLVCGDEIIRTWTTPDPTCGPPLTHTQTITLEDLTPPVFLNTPDAAITINCLTELPTFDDLEWSDNCDGTGFVPGAETGGPLDPCTGGSITRTWMYSDVCGNGPVTFNQIITLTPPIETSCDDNDDCTINDVHTLDCEGNVCIPCMGVITDCTGVIDIIVCDDGDDCTINDVLEMACDGTICVPCQGEITDCTNGLTFNEPCSDGDPCTINDFRVIDCQDQECVPCMGTPNPTPDPTLMVPSLSCSNETTTLTATDCTGTIIWYDDAAGNNIVFVGTPFVTPILTADITYYAACDVDGCLSNLIPAPITIIDAQTTTITGDDIICLGEFSTLDAGAGFTNYDWGGGNTNQTLNAAITGTYTVTVTDVNGCTSTDDFGLQVISPVLPDINGSLTFCLNGFTQLSGDAGFQYLWLPNGEMTQQITVSTAGTYSLIITDANGCTSSNSVMVSESTELEPIINGGPMFCAGEDVNISVGDGFDTYLWLPNGENGSEITVSSAGTYSVTVSDLSGCTGSSTIMITESNLPPPIITGDNPFCPGSDAELEVSSIDFTDFDWSTGSTNSFIVVDEADTYSVTVTDANGCIQSTSIVLVEDIAPEPIIDGNLFICEGEDTNLSTDGVYAVYTWSTGAQNVNNITVNTSGTYTLTVFDFNGCSGSSSVNVVSLSDLELFIEGGTTFCEGGSTQLDAGDWDAYLWLPNGENTQQITASSGGDYSVTVTDINGCTASSTVSVQEDTELSPTISGDDMVCDNGNTTLSVLGNFTTILWNTTESTQSISAVTGAYSVTVTDATGCTGSSQISVTALTPDQVTIDGELELCEGQLIDLEAIGNFDTYLWSNSQTTQAISVNTSGDYSVTATDLNGCTSSTSVTLTVNTLTPPLISGELDLCQGETETLSVETYTEYLWNTTETTQQIDVTTGGTYIVTVTDINGCTGSSAVSITAQPLPNVTILGSSAFCPGGFTTLNVNGTFTSIIWTPSNDTGSSIDVSTEGLVTVTVTDDNGCTASSSVDIEEQLNLSIEIGGDLELCEGANGTLNVGTFASYDWSTGEDTNEISITEGGLYSVTVFDQSGCSGSTDVSVNEIESFNIEISGPDYYCESQGNTTISAPAGFDTYLWSTGLNTQDLIVSSVGNYAVTVTDDLGCTGSSEVIITMIPQGTPMILGDPNFCEDESTELSLDGTYAEYLWQDGSTNSTLTASTPGIISVTVTDDLGCTASSNINVGYYDNAVAEISGSTAYCVGSSTLLDGGQAESWIWSNNEMTQTITVNTEGDYSVTITDINGCTASSEVTVTEEEFLSPNIVGDKEFCLGGSTILDAGSAFSSWVWSTDEVTQTIEVTSPGVYSVTVSDNSGCTGSNDVIVVSLLLPEPMISGLDVICLNGETTLNVNTDYSTYEWNTSDITPSLTVSNPGDYIVTVTDQSGCTASSQYTVTLGESPFANIAVNCSEDELSYELTINTDADLLVADPFVGVPTADGFTISDIPVSDAVNLTLTNSITTCDTTFMVSPPNCACSAIADAGIPGLINCDNLIFTVGGSMTSTGSDYTYIWTNQDGDVVSNDATFDTSVGGLFTLEVTDLQNDCSVTSTVFVDDQTNEPLAIISAAPDNVIDCVIDAVTLSTGEQQDVIYTWMVGKETSTALEVIVTEGGEVTLIAIDTITGCSNTGTIVIADQEEYPLLLISEPEILSCANLSVIIDASQSQSSNSIEYQWSDDQGPVVGANDLTLQVVDPGTYYLEAIDVNNNCQNVDTIEVLLLENYPTINVGDDITLPCENPESSLQVTIDNNEQETTTLWFTNDGNILTDPSQPEVTVSLAGEYYVQVFDVLTGCSTLDTINVAPNGGPSEVASQITAPECSDLESGQIQLNVVSGGTPPYVYSVNGEENDTGLFTNLMGGSYLVEVFDALGCTFLTTLVIDEPSLVELAFEEPLINLDFGDSATLTLVTNLDVSDISEIIWSPELPVDCPLCLEVIIDDVLSTTTYTATIIDSEGCEATASVILQVEREDDIFIPNIVLIGQEDETFYPQSGSDDVITDEMNIYDRWGNLIYTNKNFPTNSSEFGWDATFNGQRVEAGVYVYLFIFDVPGLGKITKAGDLTVVF